jgi:lipopolysaccharide heptosyltransferase II
LSGNRLHVYDRRERALVSIADHGLRLAALLARPFRRRRTPSAPRRILLLRIERVGDLVMALPAIRDVRALAPQAAIDLAVGSWNAELAGAVPGVARVQTLDAVWLARGSGGGSLLSLLGAARAWRTERYDLAINFEPDIRSNVLTAASGARWTVGYRSGGGGALLDVPLDYDTRAHTTANARRLVAAAFGRTPAESSAPLLHISDAARRTADQRVPPRTGPLIGVHASGGREIKQWDPARFATVARRLIQERGATIVLTGAASDRALVDRVKGLLPPERVIDVAGVEDLLTVAAILQRLDLFITGDTGPMHIAAAVGTPIVAVFGPSDPLRYAPSGPRDRVVRIDLPCAPCNRIRLPPARCVGHMPDCLAGISADHVFDAAVDVLRAA